MPIFDCHSLKRIVFCIAMSENDYFFLVAVLKKVNFT